MSNSLKVGQVLYGYCGGYFGASAFQNWRIESVGFDWVVVRKIGAKDVSFACTPGEDISLVMCEYAKPEGLEE